MLHFFSSKSLRKIKETIQQRALRMLYDDPTSDHNQFLNKSSKVSMEVTHLRNLTLRIFKVLNHVNPEYMKEILHKDTNLTHRLPNIKFNQNNTDKYGNQNLRNLGPRIWNSLPSQIIEETNYNKREATGFIQLISSFCNCSKIKVYNYRVHF